MLADKVRSRLLVIGFMPVCLFFSLSSCNKGGVDDPANSFSAITRADSTGAILSSDPSVWAPIPAVGVEFLPKGAYPDPCKAGRDFMLGWRLAQTDSISITINDSPTDVLNTLGAWLKAPGSYVVSAPMNGFKPGIYCVYFKVVRPDSTYVTYGDVQVSN